jgi:hypothetical protein
MKKIILSEQRGGGGDFHRLVGGDAQLARRDLLELNRREGDGAPAALLLPDDGFDFEDGGGGHRHGVQRDARPAVEDAPTPPVEFDPPSALLDGALDGPKRLRDKRLHLRESLNHKSKRRKLTRPYTAAGGGGVRTNLNAPNTNRNLKLHL